LGVNKGYNKQLPWKKLDEKGGGIGSGVKFLARSAKGFAPGKKRESQGGKQNI